MTTTPHAKFEVIAFFAADHAEALNGKVYMNGGFWNRLNYPQYPAVVPTMALVAVVNVPFHQYQEDHSFSLGMVDADENPAPLRVEGKFRVGASPDLKRGDPTLMPIAIPVNGLRIERPGDYSFRLSLDGEEMSRYQFRAVHVTTPLRFQLENSD